MGGVGIFAAAMLGWLLVGATGPLQWVTIAGFGLFAAGFADDVLGLSPLAKMAIQLGAAGVLMAGGLLFTPDWPLWLAVPITVVWVVGVTNAVNLLDHMDGVAAGVSTVAALALAAIAGLAGNVEVAVGSLVLAAAAGGFLAFNFNPAKTFMGDCGSLFLGVSLAGLAMAAPVGAGGTPGLVVPVVAATVLAVPIFDTTLVTVGRIKGGRSVAQGGRDHTSHRLAMAGLSTPAVAIGLYGVGLAVGAVGVALVTLPMMLLALLVSGLALGLVAAGLVLSRLTPAPAGPEPSMEADG